MKIKIKIKSADIKPGDIIKFTFDLEKIHVFDKETEQIITN